jgi:membrane fusion protein
VVTEIDVHEGDRVEKGQRLLVLSRELESAALGATEEEVLRRVAARRTSLLAERKEAMARGDAQGRALEARMQALADEEKQLGREIRIQARRVKIALRSTSRQRALQLRRMVSDEQLQSAVSSHLDLRAHLEALQRQRIAAREGRLELESQRADLPLATRAALARLDRDLAAVEQESAETEARRAIVLTAPEAGTVTALLVERGSRPASTVPLVSLVREGARLGAQLFCPSRAVGFLRAGQRVLVRYQAYPFQKFGHYEGTIAAIARSAHNPSELPSRLAGLTSLVAGGEPVYRVEVELARQSVRAYGNDVPLVPGMLLEADVLLDRRRLWEWVLDPLYTVGGTLRP